MTRPYQYSYDDDQAASVFYTRLKQCTTTLQRLMVLAVAFAFIAGGATLYLMQGAFPDFTGKVIFALKSLLLLAVAFLISNWLRRYFQAKIDESNANRYGNF